MTTYPLVFPTHQAPANLVVRSHKVVGLSSSPFSLQQQTYEHDGERWEGEFTLPPMQRAAAQKWIAWLRSLRGPIGSFLMGEPRCAIPLGAAAASPGTPQVDGVHAARARSLAVKTGLGTVPNWLLAGDMISIGLGLDRHLHEVQADASLASDGRATLELFPRLRTALTDGTTLYVSSATGLFRLTSSNVEHAIDAALHYRPAVIGCVEAL